MTRVVAAVADYTCIVLLTLSARDEGRGRAAVADYTCIVLLTLSARDEGRGRRG